MRPMPRRGFLGLALLCAHDVRRANGSTEIASTPWRVLSATDTSRQGRLSGNRRQMRIATEYALEDEISVPVVQTTFVSLLRKGTNGALDVSLAHSGREGLGATLVRKVKAGAVEAAQFSLANFAASVPIVDLVNIPYWCGSDQQFVNLVTSKAWTRRVDPQLASHGFKVLFYYTEGPRTVAKTKLAGGRAIRTPDDLRSLRVRVPPSRVADQCYRLAGATPVIIPWDSTLTAMQHHQADVLDPSVPTLHTAGFDDILASVTLTAHVPDAQVYACNLQWFNSLPIQIQRGIVRASEAAMDASLKQLGSCLDYSTRALASRGVTIYAPSRPELADWIKQTGEQREEWNPLKIELAGSLAEFDRLRRAAATRGPYTVPGHQRVQP